MNYKPIEDYGIIGNLNTVALVSNQGSIDFMCFPRFDSPSVFAALLDHQKGGKFQISPFFSDRVNHKQLYLPDTNVLLTRFLSPTGVAEVSDFMPVQDLSSFKSNVDRLVRRVKTIKGEICFKIICEPKFDYGRAEHKVEQTPDGDIIFRSEGKDGTILRLKSSVPIWLEYGSAVGEFTLSAGEHASFILESVNPNKDLPSLDVNDVADLFKETVHYWRRWIGKSTYQGRWIEEIHRSALVLKLLTSRSHGSMIAAPTFGLPEEIGGERNWDYRYTWIRDASFTLYALNRLGYTDEAAEFMHWIENRCNELNPDGSLQIMYGIEGRHKLSEERLDHFEGYMGSSPVRIGNAAYNQLQLDIYGELMDAIFLYDKYGSPISHNLWKNLVRLVNWVCRNWRQPDEGIWEVRGPRRDFLYSRLMCWVAIDRGIRLAMKRSLPGPIDEWMKTRDIIYNEIFTEFWDPRLKAFVKYKGAKQLDAACLLMPLVKFISPIDPMWLSTMRAVEDELVYDSLVYRYKPSLELDGLKGGEGTFNMCSFWYYECLARSGDLEKARLYFEKMLGYANHLGLYAEELGPCGEHLGNFPQAFTHLSLIGAAHYLNRELTKSKKSI
ncbi:MAG: glycoside hydrolase family 15 protein [Candidatus Caenarcaniphilales bacterium]|nr:glycoside hydrolase family 15 protein [Candidatus Caenarcaniphilales bacterium]